VLFPMKTLVLITVLMIPIAAGAAEMKSPTSNVPTAAPPEPATISILELHRQIDVKSLPELTIENPV
jgi:hypothetical protein